MKLAVSPYLSWNRRPSYCRVNYEKSGRRSRRSLRAFRPTEGRNTRLTQPLRAARVGYYPGQRLTTPRRYRVVSGLRSAPARLRRAYAIPLPPGMSRAVLHPRCARARPAPCPTWSVMSTAPRRVASAWIAPSLRSVTIHAMDAHDVPLRGWRTNAFRILAATPLA